MSQLTYKGWLIEHCPWQPKVARWQATSPNYDGPPDHDGRLYYSGFVWDKSLFDLMEQIREEEGKLKKLNEISKQNRTKRTHA